MHDMMRLTMAVWWSLALVWLLTSPADAEPGPGQPARRITVTGYGPTHEVAKKLGLKAAADKLHEQLRTQQLDHWRPSESFIKDRLLVDAGHIGDNVDDPPAKTWTYEIAIPDDETLKQFDRQAQRQERAESRLGFALHAAAGLALALVVLIGCIRADEWTRSRYTAWVRLAGAGALAAIVAGWCWVR
jgi:hypothetical protein